MDESRKKAWILRPVPASSLNLWSWLGALTFTAFIIQAVTGALILFHYRPLPSEAYGSLQDMLHRTSYGWLLLSLHRYGAYSMISLALVHMARNLYAGAYRRPRGLMWVIGMLMGFLVLSSLFTGYLLPWSMLSKSATDVGLGLLSQMPYLSGIIYRFMASDETLLGAFFALHVLVIPGAILLLLAAKMFFFELYGPFKGGGRPLNWFDGPIYYYVMLSFYLAGFLLLASFFKPATYPPPYRPEAAAGFTPRPEWYFLWMYQLLKVDWVQGPGYYVAMLLVSALALMLVLLPAIEKEPWPLTRYFWFAVFFEAGGLTLWGYFTPGEIVSWWEFLCVSAASIAASIAFVKFLDRIPAKAGVKGSYKLLVLLSLSSLALMILTLLVAALTPGSSVYALLLAILFLTSATSIAAARPWGQ